MSVSINGDNGLTFNDGSTQTTSPFTGGFGFRNRIINGDMRIDQRNNGSSVTASTDGTFGVDRFRFFASGGGAFTAQRSTTAPAGFSNSTLITVTTADSSIAAGDYYSFSQIIEGFNTADFAWGTASAAPITISFWVRSSVTGTFSGSIRNADVTRSYAFTYSISSANTWEHKTVTIAGDTSGTWVTNNGAGLLCGWSLGHGTTTTAGVWTAGNFNAATGQTNLIATNGATFNVTGLQLEKGSTATSFDYRPYGTELALCQRYFQVSGAGMAGQVDTTTSVRLVGAQFAVPMRTAPSGAMATSSISAIDFGVGPTTNSSPTFTEYAGTGSGGFVKISGWVAGTAYRGTTFTTNSLAFSSEL